VIFLLVGTDPLSWNGQFTFIVAVFWDDVLIADPRYKPEQSHVIYTFFPGAEFDFETAYPWYLAHRWQNRTKSSIDKKRLGGGGSNGSK
jgi:hypothetical protein